MRRDRGGDHRHNITEASDTRLADLERDPCGIATPRPLLYLAFVSLAGYSGSASAAEQSREQLEQVIIRGTRPGDYVVTDPSLSKLTQTMTDTPQSITTVTRAELDDRAVANLNDALRTVPGISLGAGETSFQGNNVFLRGFTTRNDLFVDGQRDYGYYYRDPFNAEAVEVLKGPSSILFGRGSTGGVINQVTKIPTRDQHFSAAGTLGFAGVRRATLDMNSPLPELMRGGAFRLNLVADHTEVADRNAGEVNRVGIAPSLALGDGTPTRLVFQYLYQRDRNVPDYGIPWFAGRPAAVDRANYYGFSSDYLDTDVNVATVRLEHDLGTAIRVSSQARYSRDTRRFRYSEAVIPAGTPATTPLQSIIVSRNEFQGYSTDTFLEDQTDLTARFRTGMLRHALVAGVEIGRESPEPVYVSNVGVPTTNLAHPQDGGYSVAQSYVRLTARTVAKTQAVYALDTISVGARWQFMAGIRWDSFDADYRSVGYTAAGAVAATTAVESMDRGMSYRGAVVYKPSEDSSLYASYGTSFNPSAEGIESFISAGRSVSQANLNLDPEKSRSAEIGAKWTTPNGRLLLTSSLFRLEKTNVRVPDPTAPGFNTLGGDQRVNGAELEVMGQIGKRWKIRAGYSYLDSETTRSSVGGPVVGAPLTATPRNSFSALLEYRLNPAFEAGVGVQSLSERLGQNTAAVYEVAPGYTTVEAFGKYQLSARMLLQLNVTNLGNRYFMDQLHPAHVIPGEGRAARLVITYRR